MIRFSSNKNQSSCIIKFRRDPEKIRGWKFSMSRGINWSVRLSKGGHVLAAFKRDHISAQVTSNLYMLNRWPLRFETFFPKIHVHVQHMTMWMPEDLLGTCLPNVDLQVPRYTIIMIRHRWSKAFALASMSVIVLLHAIHQKDGLVWWVINSYMDSRYPFDAPSVEPRAGWTPTSVVSRDERTKVDSPIKTLSRTSPKPFTTTPIFVNIYWTALPVVLSRVMAVAQISLEVCGLLSVWLEVCSLSPLYLFYKLPSPYTDTLLWCELLLGAAAEPLLMCSSL